MAKGTIKGERIDIENALPKLRQMMADTNDPEFMCMIWSVHAIQDRVFRNSARYFNFPKQAATSDFLSEWRAQKWDLETLVTLYLNTPKGNRPFWQCSPMNTREFDTVASLVNLLFAAQDFEGRGRIDHTNIMLEMHRISHRQFAWQRGFVRSVDVYRALYIYGQGECARFFQEAYGVSIMDFFTVAFAHMGYLAQGPWSKRVSNIDILGVSQDAIDKSLALLSADIWDMRRESMKLLAKFEKSLGISLPVIYQPSYLRIRPIIRRGQASGDLYIAPFPELITFRATVGLYYDLQPGGTMVTNDAATRFEEYGRKVLKAYCPAFDPMPAVQYVFKKNNVDTPDILLKKDGVIVAVFECKASKLSFEAQYGDDPVEDAKTGYSQIAKAIFQLWRFFSHVRRGLVKLDAEVAADAPAIVLTMDAWTQMSHELRARLIADAEDMVEEKEPEITAEDKRHPVFCPIQELDHMLATSTEGQLLTAFKTAIEPEYTGWSIREVRKRAAPAVDEDKEFPFSLQEFLPWWNDFKRQQANED
ncbi:hypothetical protein B5K08_32150 [Rhizobium leguminosarum bv. trifolii]|uniref:Uncharacterized protein n=1 Tax=Rhizobium leguminosarum bv. trifolii TaxID=386 RepID=A0A3E1AYX5_RHILT|nr:hypothetical protein [Rhizobium leguminosarum]RFB82349.1 hypothetical protein B5K10_32145 [Rhizobium leguminosarum bv. trifolii]RFB82853.1 hypothetical protein B5K08_32150 [Rhizobium leguminosarum bv. trifolii]